MIPAPMNTRLPHLLFPCLWTACLGAIPCAMPALEVSPVRGPEGIAVRIMEGSNAVFSSLAEATGLVVKFYGVIGDTPAFWENRTWIFSSSVRSLYDVQLAAHLALAKAKGFNGSALEAILRNSNGCLVLDTEKAKLRPNR